MKAALVTGCNGLIGSESVRQLVRAGFEPVVGIDNDLRSYFFGPEASTFGESLKLREEFDTAFKHLDFDIRDTGGVDAVVGAYRPEVIIHTAAQPSHDWAATDPFTDFDVNARATLGLLQAARKWVPDSPFIYCSTSKVYGEHPNDLPLVEFETRLDLPPDHRYYEGITPVMSVDRTKHSLFGVSKLAADLMVQEYGFYFGMPTVCFRPGCLTGANHRGAQLHGFLAYLMRCVATGDPYTIIGYDGKQVRDNIHASDLVGAFLQYAASPRPQPSVYNLGGGRFSNCSILEALSLGERIAGREASVEYEPIPRKGDHKWFIGADAAFKDDFPDWNRYYNVEAILWEMYEENAERWNAGH